MVKNLKIAIIGSGITGLSAGYELSRAGHRVSIFESQPAIGLSQHAIDLSELSNCGDGNAVVDVPLRLMNKHQWPALNSLYQTCEIETAEIDGSLSFAGIEKTPFLSIDFAKIFATNVFNLAASVNRKIFADIVRLRNIGLQDLAANGSDDVSFWEYLTQNRFSNEFIQTFLFPVLSSTVCTCSHQALENYPASIILDALAKITSANSDRSKKLFRAKHSARDVSQRLLQEQIAVRLNTHVDSMLVQQNGVQLRYHSKSTGQISELFDHVVLATQANHCLRLLESPTPTERSMVECFEYESVEVVVHQDRNIMPLDLGTWTAFNMRVDPAINRSMCTIWLNRFAAELDLRENVFQTINPLTEIDPQRTICRVKLQRPVVSKHSFRGWHLIDEIHSQPGRRIWFAGSYACRGIPLLETGVVSAQRVAHAINNSSPAFV